ncbi:trafficking protein particle complex subunit 4-like [Dromiciops gliroides]|uniref:trafficking protein particle complex subunit 4-like n=1 Tax=Dromiciops gliroides TaxID=33562 RepID=UPI001CC6C6F7|nr:trafficking protein particle complex subunit 4-like [Dromiciops gliroides]
MVCGDPHPALSVWVRSASTRSWRLFPPDLFVALPAGAAVNGATVIFSVYVVNKAGGLIYQLDNYTPPAKAEKTFSFPLDLLLKLHDERILVTFGQQDSIWTLTGIKFVVLPNPRQGGIDSLLRRIYEIYSDFALKNPFYSLEMPICELFDQNLKLALEVAEKAGTFGPGSHALQKRQELETDSANLLGWRPK